MRIEHLEIVRLRRERRNAERNYYRQRQRVNELKHVRVLPSFWQQAMRDIDAQLERLRCPTCKSPDGDCGVFAVKKEVVS